MPPTRQGIRRKAAYWFGGAVVCSLLGYALDPLFGVPGGVCALVGLWLFFIKAELAW